MLAQNPIRPCPSINTVWWGHIGVGAAQELGLWWEVNHAKVMGACPIMHVLSTLVMWCTMVPLLQARGLSSLWQGSLGSVT